MESENPTSPVTPEAVRAALRHVVDPEVGLNVVDLGLVHEVRVAEHGVRVLMTMTTPACPLGPYLRNEVTRAVRDAFPGLAHVEVELVWEPRWTPDRISPEGRVQLGWSS
ncbi:MAG: metal-sulfur cluster assembly factor [Myxococcota bacterium]